MENQQFPRFPLPPRAFRFSATSTLQVESQQPHIPPKTYYCTRSYHGHTIPQPDPESLRRAPPFRGWAADVNDNERVNRSEQRVRGFKSGVYWLCISLFIMIVIGGCGVAAIALMSTWKAPE